MGDHRLGASEKNGLDEVSLAQFRELASGPSIIEAPRNKQGLVLSSLSALARVARGTAAVAVGGVALAGVMAGVIAGVSTLETAYNSAFNAVPPLGVGTYGGIVAEMQAEADALVGPGKILVYDRSAPADFESRRVAAHLEVKKKKAAELPGIRGGGAYAGWTAGGEVCILMGPDPHETAPEAFHRLQERPVNPGDVTKEVTQRFVFGHEFAHCALTYLFGKEIGHSEARADVFALLMAIRDGKSKDILPLVTAHRELDEYTYRGIDHYYNSPSLRWLLEKAEDPAFVERVRRATLVEIADLARMAPVPESMPEVPSKLRDAIYYLGDNGVNFVVPVEEGFVMTGKWDWLRMNSEVPEFRHMVALSDYLSGDPETRTLPTAFVPDRAASAAAITAIAARGDPKAARLVHLLGGTPPAAGAPWSEPIYRANQVKGHLVGFNRDRQTVSFEGGGRYFRINHAETGKALAGGIVGEGITRTFFVPEAQAGLELDDAPAPFKS